MKKAWFLLVLAAGCAGTPGEARERGVREAFEAWRDAGARGDADAVFAGLSTAFRSQWLFDLMVRQDVLAARWRERMTGAARTDLDLWLEHSKKYPPDTGRVEGLPGTVLRHPTLLHLWQACFSVDAAAARRQMSRLEVREVYVDANGASVTVFNTRNTIEMYAMVPEGDGWKIDNHRSAPAK